MSDRGRRIALILFIIGVAAAVFAAGRYETSSRVGDVKNRVAKVESPCLKYGSKSRQCHKSFSAAIASITDYQLCTLLAQRPDLTHVHPSACRKIAEEAREHAERVSGEAERRSSASGPVASVPPEAGDATSAPTGSSQPGRHDGGSSESGPAGNGEAGRPPRRDEPPKVPAESGGGGKGVPQPPASSPSSESSSSSSTTTTERTKETVVEAPSAPEAEAPVRTGGLSEVLGGVGKTLEEPGPPVEEVGHGVNETVHGVTCGLGLSC